MWGMKDEANADETVFRTWELINGVYADKTHAYLHNTGLTVEDERCGQVRGR